jgi:hypothetical protein
MINKQGGGWTDLQTVTHFRNVLGGQVLKQHQALPLMIPDGDYLFPTNWNRKTEMHPVTVFKNLSSLLILGLDAIDNLGITYQSRTKKIMFQEELYPEKFQKADIRVICTLKIPAHT